MNNQPPPTSNRRTINGVVTKLVGDTNNYGFINNEIFFPQTHVIGGPASVGDQVYAECEFSENLPIKWNATSVKILNKASGGQQQQGGSRIEQQHVGNDSSSNNNQQYGSTSQPVAMTYQQHRQQRQRLLDNKQSDVPVNPTPPSDLTAKLLEQQNNQSSEFFGANNPNRPFNQQQPMDTTIQPFQETPMGPPNFTYTSQLGSAFVQNQFVPQQFLSQPPAPMLPHTQQQAPPPPPQHLLQQAQPLLNKNQNQRHNVHGKNNISNNNTSGGSSRFNNQGDKNDRQNQRRNMNNRNDNKFDRSRNNDSDYGNQKHMGNDRSTKRNENRDGSLNRGSKRDDGPSRPSPTPQSARSNTSSDRGNKPRRHYEVQNIPKCPIMTNMNAFNMKQRCPQSLHVPSDLKEVILNKYFRLDIKNIPKPLQFNIEQSTKEQTAPQDSDIATAAVDPVDKETAPVISESLPTDQSEPKKEVKSEQPTPPTSSRSEHKLFHKYGVKVILLSLPEMNSIYKSVFGQNLDSYTSDSRYQTKLTETISLLCNKGSNNGYSLIGGKFDPVLDGYLEGKSSEFERHGRQPDLLSTCKRVVLEQTGLDLGQCQSWTHVSTFVYNNKSDYFSAKASVEYSYIYMPQLWTLLSDSMNNEIKKEREVCSDPEPAMEVCEGAGNESNANLTEAPTSESSIGQTSMEKESQEVKDIQADQKEVGACTTATEAQNVMIPGDLKVTDLKNELDRRGIKYKANSKKAELAALLQETIQQNSTEPEVQDSTESIEQKAQPADENAADNIGTEPKNESESNENPPVKTDDTAEAPEAAEATEAVEDDKEEGEIKAEQSDESSDGEVRSPSNEAGTKRKATDSENDEDGVNKRVCTSDADLKAQRFDLIREAFAVKARDEQQQLSLVSLHDISLAARHDQFELSVTGVILRESLVKHLSEYILTALIEENKNKSVANQSTDTSNSSDTNNNDTSKSNSKDAGCNPPTVTQNLGAKAADVKTGLKDLPADRYITLAFSLFDSTHMGYVYFEDLNKLFNNTDLTISKRALISLIGDGEKFNYRRLPDLSPKLPPTYLYEFPKQFSCIDQSETRPTESTSTISNGMVEHRGVLYDIEKLVKQVREAETLRVSLVDRFNYAIENSDKQAEEIHVLEVSQKSLSKAIKVQNDEICDLKRDRDSIKKKLDALRKGLKGTISSLNDLIKEEK